MKLLRRVLTLCAKPHAARWIIALAVLLVLPALMSPPVAEDVLHSMRFGAESGLLGFDDPNQGLFEFATGEPAQRAGAMKEGLFSWWTAPDLKLAFWRPLSVATHYLDYLLWKDQNALIHAHSVLWFLVLLVAIHRLYARFHTPQIAALALALYAFDDARGFVLSFASNRNALIAAVMGGGVLIAHDRWRRDGWKLGVLLGPLLLGVGLLSAELALATTGFLFAYALFIDPGERRAKWASLVPYAVVVVAWQITYSHLGYGVTGSGVYVHPLHEPLHFAAKLVERGPVLALAQVAGPPSDFWILYPWWLKTVVYAFAVAVLVGVGKLLWPRLEADPTMRFWLLGGVLALVPVSATFLLDRLLVFVGIGAAGAFACLFAHAVGSPPSTSRRRATAALVVIHLIVAPLFLPARSLSTLLMNAGVSKVDQSIPADPSVAQQSLVVLNIPADGMVTYAVLHRAARKAPRPRNIRVLSSGFGETEVTRLDAHTLRVRPTAGFYATEAEQMLRSPNVRSAVGDTVTLTDMVVTVTEVTDDGRAAEADFRFPQPLEAPGRLWMRWHHAGELVAWTPPPVGSRVVLAAPW